MPACVSPALSRRRFLQLVAAGSLSATQVSAFANTLTAYDTFEPTPDLAVLTEKKLHFKNLHTGESLATTYWAEGHYIAENLVEIDYVLRDHRVDKSYPIDTDLLDLLYDLQQKMDNTKPIQIISAYRSPETNAKLRKKSNGVAKRSLHMQGKAIDIRFSQCELSDLRQAAIDLRRGGVGYYPKSEFIHVDVGSVRQWG